MKIILIVCIYCKKRKEYMAPTYSRESSCLKGYPTNGGKIIHEGCSFLIRHYTCLLSPFCLPRSVSVYLANRISIHPPQETPNNYILNKRGEKEPKRSTFFVRSLKQSCTFSLVLALHSRNKQLCSFANARPSSLLTALSLSWK